MTKQMGRRGLQKGVTLIELMIVVVIFAIIAGVAYPSYQLQVRKSRRAAAQAFLMQIAASEQQRMVDVRSYADTIAALNLAVPADLTSFYTASISAPAGTRTFVATMTAIGSQAADAGCSALTLDHAGAKSPSTCW
jgi:type IV pilus assembly protein PilE